MVEPGHRELLDEMLSFIPKSKSGDKSHALRNPKASL
jgi:hypothetical protein